jgi:dipeptidyl aminopeptidase/acylaminoacyl peptidase
VSEARPALPYGSWPSPLTAAAVAAGRLRLQDLQFDGDDLYWVEGRPAEQGRCVIVRHRDGRSEDILPAPFSARTTVHEYGGGAFRATSGTVVFANARDRRLHVVGDGAPEPLTPDLGDVRYADMELDAARERILCVVEDHRGPTVVNTIAAVPVGGGEPLTVLGGNDFYSNPRVNPDATRMCWLTWNQPQMPWDGTELWVADIGGDGMPINATRIAGDVDESIVQPEWSRDGVLHFVSDRSGWWNLYRASDDVHLDAVAPLQADCGVPAWTFRRATYAFLADGRIALSVCRDGIWSVGIAVDGAWTQLDVPCTDISAVICASGSRVALISGDERTPHTVRIIEGDGTQCDIRHSSDLRVDEASLSNAEPITFPGWGGGEGHAFLYMPRNVRAQAPADELPPLYVQAHGGPTSACSASFDPMVQYWTTRGFAFLDVNYGGSTGFGRAYRQRLNGEQGVVDIGDCVNAALHLAERGVVDGRRLVIEGGSAGGYIVLGAMTFHPEVFAAGISLFGISDLELLIRETHKFEARYFDSMIGPYPERAEAYRERSPIHHIDAVRHPVFLLQGLDDPIVPANQAQTMYDRLRERGIPCAYIAFEGEQHGFRMAASIVRTLEGELYFLSRILGFDLPKPLEPVEIANVSKG